jgi:hypothetical protein
VVPHKAAGSDSLPRDKTSFVKSTLRDKNRIWQSWQEKSHLEVSAASVGMNQLLVDMHSHRFTFSTACTGCWFGTFCRQRPHTEESSSNRKAIRKQQQQPKKKSNMVCDGGGWLRSHKQRTSFLVIVQDEIVKSTRNHQQLLTAPPPPKVIASTSRKALKELQSNSNSTAIVALPNTIRKGSRVMEC